MAKSVKFKIMEDTWTCRFMSEVRYKKTHPEHAESSGITNLEKKIIDLKDTVFSFKTIMHELSHAYNSYLNLQDTNTIEWDDLTEILSTSSEKNILLMLEKVLIIYNKFSKIETNKIDRESLLKLVKIAQKWEK